MTEVGRQWVDRLLQAVPDMATRIDAFDQDLPYVAFGMFAGYVRELLLKEPVDTTALDPALGLMAEMAESEDQNVHGLLAVGALEGLIGNIVIVERLRPRLTSHLRNLYDYTVLAWYGDPPLSWSYLNLNTPPDPNRLEQAFVRIRDGHVKNIFERIIEGLDALAYQRYFRFRETKKEDAEHYLKQFTTFEGLSEEEITALEASLQTNFPIVFRGYLQTLGKARGELFKGSEADPQRYQEYRLWAKQLLQENGMPTFLTKSTVVFLFHQGYSFVYFESAAAFDVPVYRFVEGNDGPQQIAPSFAEFLSSELKQMEQLNKAGHLSGGYFLTVNQQGVKQIFPAQGSTVRPVDSDDQLID